MITEKFNWCRQIWKGKYSKQTGCIPNIW